MWFNEIGLVVVLFWGRCIHTRTVASSLHMGKEPPRNWTQRLFGESDGVLQDYLHAHRASQQAAAKL